MISERLSILQLIKQINPSFSSSSINEIFAEQCLFYWDVVPRECNRFVVSEFAIWSQPSFYIRFIGGWLDSRKLWVKGMWGKIIMVTRNNKLILYLNAIFHTVHNKMATISSTRYISLLYKMRRSERLLILQWQIL